MDSILHKDKVKKNDTKALAGAAVLASAVVAAGMALKSDKGQEMLGKVKSRVNDTAEADTETGDSLVGWLQDAYAMEEGQIKTLKGVMVDFRHDEDIHLRLEQHLRLTEKQKDDVRKCLEALDEKPSKTKEF